MCGGTLKEGLEAIAEHHQPRSRARTNRALRSLARALRDAAPRTRALLRSPARAGPGSRARALEASLVRLLHSLRAEWAVGSSCSAGWEGEEGRGRRRSAWGEGPHRASGEGAGKRGQAPPSRATRATVRVGSVLGPGPPPPPTPFCKTIPVILLLPSRDSWKGTDPEVLLFFFFSPPRCCSPPRTQNPRLRKERPMLFPPSLSVPNTL